MQRVAEFPSLWEGLGEGFSVYLYNLEGSVNVRINTHPQNRYSRPGGRLPPETNNLLAPQTLP